MQADTAIVTQVAFKIECIWRPEKATSAPFTVLLMLHVVRNFLNVKQIYLTNIGINVKAPFLYNLFANYNTIRYNGNHDKDV